MSLRHQLLRRKKQLARFELCDLSRKNQKATESTQNALIKVMQLGKNCLWVQVRFCKNEDPFIVINVDTAAIPKLCYTLGINSRKSRMSSLLLFMRNLLWPSVVFHIEIVIQFPAVIYFKVNNRNTRTMCEIGSDLTIKTPKRRHDVVLVSLLLTLNKFHTLLWCSYCWLWANKCQLVLQVFIRNPTLGRNRLRWKTHEH